LVKVVLTAPATEMSNHHGKEFLGFGTCSPPTVVPAWFIKSFFYPKIESRKGIVGQAPYGLRKMEAKLIEEGFDVVTVHPYDIESWLADAKAVGISVMDPLGFGPVSVTFTAFLGGNASTRIEFLKLMEKLRPYKEKIKIIVGGAGAWQLEWDKRWKNYVDCIIVGEGDEVVADVFKQALNGNLPKIVRGKPADVSKIPVIRNPSINGLIEVSRGRGRGCRFCSETLKKRRDIPLDNILKEAKVCSSAGGVILHAEDVLLYGCKDARFIPNEKKVIELFKAVKRIVPQVSISHCSLAAVASKPSLVERIDEILEIDKGMFGVQTGIETGSRRLMEEYMHGKCLPFHPSDWCDVVEEAFAIMHENRWIPAATLVIGLPSEREEDVISTIELVERLRHYRSLIVPLIFIPMEVCALRRQRLFTRENLKPVHYELMALCMDHCLHWVESIMKDYFKGLKSLPIKLGFWAFEKWVKRSWSKRRKELEELKLEEVLRCLTQKR